MAPHKVQQLKQLIQEAAGEKDVPPAWMEFLDDHRLGLLVQHDMTDRAMLCVTTKEEFMRILGSLGAANALKMLFPSTSEGDTMQHLRMLLPQKPAAWPQDANAMRVFLNDHSGMCIPVVAGAKISAVAKRHHGQLQVVHPSELAANFTTYIISEPVDRLNEMTTTCAVHDAYKATIEQFRQLDYEPFTPRFFSNMSTASSSTGSSLSKKRKRPDSFLVVNNLTLLLGEDKQAEFMNAALNELRGKLTNLDLDFYVGSSFLLAYTAAGTHIRFYFITFQGGWPEVMPVTNELDMAAVNNRVYMIMVMAKLYVFMKHMAKQQPDQYPLFHELKRAKGTTVTFLPCSVEKRIKQCARFFSRFSTTEAAAAKAYRAARQEQEAAKATGRPSTLITAVGEPENINGTWHAELSPLLYPCDAPRTEQDLLDIGFTLCTAAAALHKEGVVHRDFRLDNVMQHKNGRDKVVIDLELAAEADQAPKMILCDWNSTLEDGKYTCKSDMYQVGVLLNQHSHHVCNLSQQAREFFAALEARQLAAAEALDHPWLLLRQKPEGA